MRRTKEKTWPLAYDFSVRTSQPAGNGRQSRLIQGLMLCALAVVFALAAKVSWYHPHHHSERPIASMKAFPAEQVSSFAVASVESAGMPFLPVLVALMTVWAVVWQAVTRPEVCVAVVRSPECRKIFNSR